MRDKSAVQCITGFGSIVNSTTMDSKRAKCLVRTFQIVRIERHFGDNGSAGRMRQIQNAPVRIRISSFHITQTRGGEREKAFQKCEFHNPTWRKGRVEASALVYRFLSKPGDAEVPVVMVSQSYPTVLRLGGLDPVDLLFFGIPSLRGWWMTL
jgi:hypothetical protein